LREAIADAPASARERPVTTTDVLKCVAILLVLVDHHGFFFDSANPWWRLFGRVAAPIFFFLIGFAQTRRVPWTWLALGAALTAIDALKVERLADTMVNILINFALLRAVVLPLVERHVMPKPVAVALLVGICVPLFPFTEARLEYGTGGWLWAFLGLAHRLALQDGTRQAVWTRNGIAAAAATAYILREVHVLGFTGLQTALLFPLIGGLCAVLLHFRREALAWQPPAPVAAILRFGGRFTLEIYGGTLFVSHAVAYAIAA
jgi:hypothetical protein